MKQVAGLIPTYSSDEFGICSALYELGGMVVMHDASGCNSTYTTHDEPRWYDIDSMIYISAISEMEAIMGDDDKLIQDLVETAGELHPAFVAVVGAPIPYMIGTDLRAIAAVTEEQTGIRCFGFEANGMHDYTHGVSMAMETIAEKICEHDLLKTKELSVNILGATPLDFALNGSVESMRKWLTEAGIKVNAVFAMGSSLEEVRKAGKAHVNLVISSGGYAAAQKMEKLFGQPYVVGTPFGEAFSEILLKEIKEADKSGISRNAYKKTVDGKEKNRILLIGDAVYSASLATALNLEYGVSVQVACPLEKHEGLLREMDLYTPEEDDLLKAIRCTEFLIADPFYQVLIRHTGEEKEFLPLPHEAFSGRIYDAVNPNLITEGLRKYFDEKIKAFLSEKTIC